MKKNLNKLATLALTGILMTGMSFGALADENVIGSNGIAGAGNSVTIKKWIGVVNHTASGEEKGTDVPDVEFTYTVEGTRTSAKIGTYSVEEGVGAPVPTAAVFDDTLNIADDKKVESKFTVSFENVEFPRAGVYRYTVRENDPTCMDITGKEDVKYLDVYVDADGGITNYVLLDADVDRDGVEGGDATKKKEGFDWKVDDNGNTIEGDVYNTYDLVVKKVISGNTSVKTMSFTFDIDVEKGENGVDRVKHSYFKNAEDAEQLGDLSGGTYGYGVVEKSLSDNDTITIKNVPASANVKVKETNTTVTTFDVSLAGATFDGGETTAVLQSGTSSYVQTSTAAVGNGYKEITVTNTYNSVPVTGVVMNIAPYAAMILGAGAFAGVFLGRGKSEDEE